MEIASTAISVIGLASLFSTCIETLDILSSAARYGINREILQTRIEVERLRLRVWGESVGLAEINPDSEESEITENDLAILDESIRSNTLRPAVAGLLTCFAHYFEDIEELQKRYGLAPRQNPALGKTPTRGTLLSKFQKTFLRFQERTSEAQKKTSPLKKAVWAVTDERKFRALLAEIKAINDSLVSLLPAIGEKVRVRMRSEIMKNKDVGQLQNIVNAADDITGLIAETASLRLDILSTSDRRQTRYQALELPRAKTLAPKATPATAPTPSPAPEPKSVVESLITASLDATPSSISAPPGSLDDSYDDSGALIIHVAYYKQECFRCFSWVVGSGESPERRSQVQSVSHPIFEEFQFFPEAVLSIADDLLEADVAGDKKYAGWSPGSTSLTGFAREISLWQIAHSIRKKDELKWSRTKTKPLLSQFVDQRWREIVKDGLGEDFTDKKGYERLRELIGPAEHTWLDPDENIKLRHQITDLLGAMSSSMLPNLEEVGSMSLVAYREKLDPDSQYCFVDFMRQLLLAREANLRIQRAERRWYGGITNRVIYDMVAADLFASHMELKDGPEQGYTPSPGVVKQQLDGVIKFADEMQWPYADEIRQAA
ncbi:hypothetical protein CNMCM5623_004401 [Aspergillus felis]|uniref:Prion-inhibition and propagation HeLo domain-containing protein n=1 Tax=Aspergillus felis TaxID=1287682 RepID=A0A8H6QHS3_9EURO|nr:hypothetical protein CNMCM5623_004401 [Aspergillus felis]